MTSPASRSLPLRSILRWSAVLVLVTTGGFWAAQGAHRGWSMNQVPLQQTDEITGIAYVRYEDRFVPGIDFLLASGAAAVGLLTSSFFFNAKPKTTHP